MLARYFERIKAIIERHGGTVENFIGDAVIAVFGVPAAHEDDALRAVRAAAEMLWRQALARVHARRGQHSEAERLAREAVAIGEATESLNHQADTHGRREVLGLAGRPEDAAEAFEQALSRYEAKENVVMAGRMRERLAALGAEVG